MKKNPEIPTMKPMKPVTMLILLLVVVALAIAPLILKQGAEFGGADGEAEAAISEIAPEYTPWFGAIFEPASGEIESLLFALQAAIGSGVVFYYLGYMKGRSEKDR